MTAGYTTVDTDVLVVGAGAGGLWAALSARRHGGENLRVALLDAHMVGRTGHTAFSNAWLVVLTPEDDLDACVRDIVEGNEWMADQELVRETLAGSYDRLKDMERAGLVFKKEGDRYVRRPTRGLKVTKVLHPDGGGLEFCWKLREQALAEGVELAERIFITGLVRSTDGGVAGAFGVDGRTGQPYLFRARATILATNSVTFRAGFVRDITGTGPLLAYEAGARITNAEFSYLRPGTPKFYFEGITFAIQDGAAFVNDKGEHFMERYAPEWGDRADVQTIAAAFCHEKQAGNDPVYLDMSLIPDGKRDYYFHSMVKWMDLFLSKLDSRARIDMFGKTPYYPLNQMTKMAIHTDSQCRSNVAGLLAAGLAQSGCVTHFAGFHIGLSIGNGWIAGRSAVEEAAGRSTPVADSDDIATQRQRALAPLDGAAGADSDRLLKELQTMMFRYDVTVLKRADRLERSLARLGELRERAATLRAPDPHELVRLHELNAMLLAAEMILVASQARTETRLSHVREDFPQRDDARWLKWIDVFQENGRMQLGETAIPTPLVPPPAVGAAV